ncbi:MAG: winged helix-turn-helix domain-containing protein, partial [Chloroflexi bacterium]|nr:winged helix-turn-helix domain-containing protein [Chloroflexota bacterium]
MQSLSLSLLGTFQTLREGAPFRTFRSDKERALLAYLAVESDRPHRRATLAALFWSQNSETLAANNLRKSFSRLRQALREKKNAPYLLINSTEAQFNPDNWNPQSTHPCWLDVREFDQLLRACRQHKHRRLESCAECQTRMRRAVELYRGEFLEGLSL